MTGYGQQSDLFISRIESLGHRVTVYAYYGIQGNSTNYKGHLVLPGGQDPYGSDIIAAHLERTGANLLITLLDAWVLDKGQIRDIQQRLGVPVACWLPVDVARLGDADYRFLAETAAFPIAMSQHGLRELHRAGFTSAAYVPHGVDTQVFRPPEDRVALRKQFNLDGKFTIGLNKANKDQVRAAFGEQFEAFRRFHEKHPDSILSVHSLRAAPTGLNLLRMAERKGISDAIAFNDQYAMTIGAITPAMMADWYGALDLLTITSYGEGFGVPALEAMSCGTPVVVNDAAAQSELCGSGWKVRGQPFYNDHHGEDWSVPFISEIVRAYEKAYDMWKRGTLDRKREQARAFALQYNADRVLREYWVPVLARLEGMTRKARDSRRDRALTLLSDAWSGGRLDAEEFGKRARVAVSGDGDLESVTAGLEAA